MKLVKIIALFLCVCMILSACCVHNNEDGTTSTTLLRIHVRANSNDTADQSVKMIVKDELTSFLEDELVGVTDFDDAIAVVKRVLPTLKRIAKRTLEREGFSYGVRVAVKNEYFPTRSYYGVVVESGYYDALIVELGEGKGDNWWCVIYPPLCFVSAKGNGQITYRSKIKELWDEFIKG